METKLPVWKYIRRWVLVVIVIIVLFNIPFVTINSSERWVVSTLGKVQEQPLWAGFHIIKPFIDVVRKVSIVPQTISIDIPVDANWTITKDNQTIWADLTVFFKYKSTELVNIAKNYGFDVLQSKIQKDTIEAFKQTIGAYSIYDVAPKQEEIRQLAIKAIVAKISTYPISIDDVKVANYDWSKEFDAQIAKTMQIAQESKQQEQELNKVKFSAQQQVIQAQANFDAEKLNADAQKVKGQGIADYNAAITSNPKNMEFELARKQLDIDMILAERWDWVRVPANNYWPIPVFTQSEVK